MGCGWCKLPMEEICSLSSPQSIRVPLLGGTPLSPVDIPNEEVLQRRRGWRRIVKAITGQSSPELWIKIVPVNKMQNQSTDIAMLPTTIISSMSSIRLIRIYREMLAESILSPSAGFSSEPFADPVLKIFPRIVDDFDVCNQFLEMWKVVYKDVQKRKSNIRSAFRDAVLRFWPAISCYSSLGHDVGQEVTVEQRKSRILELVQSPLLTFSPPSTSQDVHLYKPFNIKEVAFDMMLRDDIRDRMLGFSTNESFGCPESTGGIEYTELWKDNYQNVSRNDTNEYNERSDSD